MTESCRGAVIFLHGSGDSGSGVQAWIDSVDPSFFKSMSDNHIKMIFPTAPNRPYSMAGGEKMNVWHDRWSFGNNAKEDVDGVDETIEMIKSIIDDLNEKDGISNSNIIIGGFSMGGGVSLIAGLSLNHVTSTSSFAGVFSMSSWVSTESRLWPTLDSFRETSKQTPQEEASNTDEPLLPPILMIHGSHDSLINIKWAEETRDILMSKGLNVQWLTEMNLDHEPGIQGLTMLSTWIKELLLK